MVITMGCSCGTQAGSGEDGNQRSCADVVLATGQADGVA